VATTEAARITVAATAAVATNPATHLARGLGRDPSQGARALAGSFASPFFREFRDLKERFARAHEACSYSGHHETFEQALARYGAHATV